MKSIPDQSVKLVVTSPPYNIGKEYEKRKDLTLYLDEQEDTMLEAVRILTDDGSICWQVGNHIAKDGEVFPIDALIYAIGKRLGLKLRNRIVWHFGHGLHCSKRFSGRHETIVWFTKSDDYTFNLELRLEYHKSIRENEITSKMKIMENYLEIHWERIPPMFGTYLM